MARLKAWEKENGPGLTEEEFVAVVKKVGRGKRNAQDDEVIEDAPR